ncbi:hypothetical protein [Capnocytophaga sp. oral taxon 878]|uniref:hypothetical protein n=1 Tax=Capnocytophaga sp. oral taxon 878 TaxID=1316596 RepID=UPI0020C3560F|nr:hypothetical protein [Capnocytophaga sp. oral taxon 878]
MSTIILEKVEIKESDFHLFEELFKKFKVKYQELTTKKEEPKMTKEAFFARIEKASASKEHFISNDEMEKMLLM